MRSAKITIIIIIIFFYVFVPWLAMSYHSFGSECLVNKMFACMLYQ